MKHVFRALGITCLLLFIAACSEQATTPTQTDVTENAFSFRVNPTTQSVDINKASALAIVEGLQCNNEVPATLIPNRDLTLLSMTPVWLPGNILRLEAVFQNVSSFDYKELNFTQANAVNIVSSTEPATVAALAKQASTTTLNFEVNHKGSVFTYEVLAKAIVMCEPEPEADLEVTKTDPVDPVEFNNDTAVVSYSYTVVIKNIGNGSAEAVVLKDSFKTPREFNLASLPAGCTIDATETAVMAVAVDPTVAPNQNTLALTCQVGDLAPDAEKTYVFDYNSSTERDGPIKPTNPTDMPRLVTQVDETEEQTAIAIVENTAVVSTTSPETNLANNTAVETTTLVGNIAPETATIIIKKVTVPEGTDQDFSFSGNIVPSSSFTLNAAGTDSLSAEVNTGPRYIVSEAVTEGWNLTDVSCDGPSGTPNTVLRNVTINAKPGETVTCTFTNTAIVEDPEADLEVTKVDDVDPVEASNKVTYTIKVKNNGPAPAENVVLTDELRFALDFTNGVGNQVFLDNCDVTLVMGGEDIRCELGTLAVDEEVTLTMEVTPGNIGEITNTATVSSDTTDPNMANDTATQTTEVIAQAPRLGSIQVLLQTNPEDGTDFAFTITRFGKSTINTILDDDNDLTRANNITLINLNEGDHNITEVLPEDWTLESVDCGTANVTNLSNGVTVALEKGQDVTCTFTNTYIEPEPLGSITIRKSVDNNDFADQLFDFTFNGTPFQVSENGDAFFVANLPAGTYTVLENVPANWNLGSINCGGPNNNTGAMGGINIVLEEGENADCTFNNNYIEPASITIPKSVDN